MKRHEISRRARKDTPGPLLDQGCFAYNSIASTSATNRPAGHAQNVAQARVVTDRSRQQLADRTAGVVVPLIMVVLSWLK